MNKTTMRELSLNEIEMVSGGPTGSYTDGWYPLPPPPPQPPPPPPSLDPPPPPRRPDEEPFVPPEIPTNPG